MLLVGGTDAPAGRDKGFWVKPTLFVDVDNSMTIAQEEIFGPVLVVIPFEDEEDAIRIANDSIYGLAGNVMSGSLERSLSVARRLRAGFIGVNGGAPYGADVPFGGYKASGVGRQNGFAGFDQYTEIKSVAYPVMDPRPDARERLLRPLRRRDQRRSLLRLPAAARRGARLLQREARFLCREPPRRRRTRTARQGRLHQLAVQRARVHQGRCRVPFRHRDLRRSAATHGAPRAPVSAYSRRGRWPPSSRRCASTACTSSIDWSAAISSTSCATSRSRCRCG